MKTKLTKRQINQIENISKIKSISEVNLWLSIISNKKDPIWEIKEGYLKSRYRELRLEELGI